MNSSDMKTCVRNNAMDPQRCPLQNCYLPSVIAPTKQNVPNNLILPEMHDETDPHKQPLLELRTPSYTQQIIRSGEWDLCIPEHATK